MASGSESCPQQPSRTGTSPHYGSRHPRKSLKYEELDWTTPWHDTHLLTKKTNCTPWTLSSTSEPAGTHPDWLTHGQTILIIQDPQNGVVPSNYQQITCLCTTWKLLSGIVADKMSRHMAQYMSGAQRGLGSNTWGDIQICASLGLTTRNPMTQCHTHGSQFQISNAQITSYLPSRCSVPFAVLHRPESHQPHNCKEWQRIPVPNWSNHSHPLYMDDMKLYASTERDIYSLTHLTRIYSKEIRCNLD